MPQKKVAFKVCRDCGERKGVSSFYVKERRKYAIRYFSRCKPCYYRWVYGRDRAGGLKWHGENQKNGRVRQMLRGAIAKGDVIKPRRCERCGRFAGPRKLRGHHDDYEKPLSVRWLCVACHKLIHPR